MAEAALVDIDVEQKEPEICIDSYQQLVVSFHNNPEATLRLLEEKYGRPNRLGKLSPYQYGDPPDWMY